MKSISIRARPLAAVLLWMLTASAGCAAALKEAESARDCGDFVSAFNQFKQLATSGNTAAQFQLSLNYGAGRGTRLDTKDARYWLCMSATHGNPQAQSNLGVAFSKGTLDGVPK